MQGTKCKFSHDLTMGSKGRLDLHRDLRDVRAEESSEAKEGGERATAASRVEAVSRFVASPVSMLSLACRCCLTLCRFVSCPTLRHVWMLSHVYAVVRLNLLVELWP
jgi:hypothetical protein